MPAQRSLDAGTEHFPKHMLKAQGVDRSWTEKARCKKNTSAPGGGPAPRPGFAWTVDPKERGRHLLGHPASSWIEMALIVCASCPAQYDCARFAVVVQEEHCTWAMHVEDLKAITKDPKRALLCIGAAEEMDIPVQVAVRRVLHAQT